MIRRRFARLAGPLELADAEFAAIRNDLSAYEVEVPAFKKLFQAESEPKMRFGYIAHSLMHYCGTNLEVPNVL